MFYRRQYLERVQREVAGDGEAWQFVSEEAQQTVGKTQHTPGLSHAGISVTPEQVCITDVSTFCHSAGQHLCKFCYITKAEVKALSCDRVHHVGSITQRHDPY